MTGDTRHHYGTWGQLGQESWIVTRSWRSEECANAPSIKAKPTMPPHTSPQPAAAASHIAFKFPWPIIRIHTIQLILDMSSTMRHYSMPCPTSMADQYIGPFMQSNKTNLERVQPMWIDVNHRLPVAACLDLLSLFALHAQQPGCNLGAENAVQTCTAADARFVA